MEYLLGLFGLILAYFGYEKIRSFFAVKKLEKMDEKIEEQAKKTNDAVTRAAVSRESFLEKYRKFRNK